MYVRFNVEFPETMTEAQAQAIRAAMPVPATAANGNGAMDLDDVEEVQKITDVPDIEAELKGRVNVAKGVGESYDSDDDDDMPRGQRVQCAQQ